MNVARAPLRGVLDQVAPESARLWTAILDAQGQLSGECSCLVNGPRCTVSGLDGAHALPCPRIGEGAGGGA